MELIKFLTILFLSTALLVGCTQQTPKGNTSMQTPPSNQTSVPSSNNTNQTPPANQTPNLPNNTGMPPKPGSNTILQGAIKVSELTASPVYNASVKVYGIVFNSVERGFYIGPEGREKAGVDSRELIYVDYKNSNITVTGIKMDDAVVVTGTLVRHDMGQGIFSYEMLATKVEKVYPIPP